MNNSIFNKKPETCDGGGQAAADAPREAEPERLELLGLIVFLG